LGPIFLVKPGVRCLSQSFFSQPGLGGHCPVCPLVTRPPQLRAGRRPPSRRQKGGPDTPRDSPHGGPSRRPSAALRRGVFPPPRASKWELAWQWCPTAPSPHTGRCGVAPLPRSGCVPLPSPWPSSHRFHRFRHMPLRICGHKTNRPAVWSGLGGGAGVPRVGLGARPRRHWRTRTS